MMRRFCRSALLIVASTCAVANAQAPQGALAQIVAMLIPPTGVAMEWRDLERVSAVRWEPLPPNMLADALPDGAMFTRKGVVAIDRRPVNVMATGTRSTVTHVYFRNHGDVIGESAVLAALRGEGFVLDLARCPIRPSPEASNTWWRIKGPGEASNWFYSQTNCDGKRCEGFALFLVDPPSMTPEERRLYTDRCSPNLPATPAAPVVEWDEQLASLFISLIPSDGTPSVDWKSLEQAAVVRWKPLPPDETTQPLRDTNRFIRQGETDLGGRVLYLYATGTKANVLNVHIEDQWPQTHRGDALRALERRGFEVRLARCGKVYSLSRSEWYRVTKAGLRPIHILRHTRCDTAKCPSAQESYTLALIGTLPPLAPGEVQTIAGRCPGR